MKQSFPDLAANDRLRSELADGILSSRLSHAYILEGAAGSGKHMLALRIAAALSCERKTDPSAPLPCCTCASCRKILAGKSPDFITVSRGDKATLGVDAIRDLRKDVYVAPNDTDTKIYVIEDAHLLTVQAQNALLLTLEEPPAYVLFLLLCESAATLLETIRSRAPILRMEPVPLPLMEKTLLAADPAAKNLKLTSPGEFADVLIAANGSIGRAKQLLSPKLRAPIVAMRETAREFVKLCAGGRNSAAALRFSAGLPQKREELIPQLQVFLYCVRDLLLCKQTENAPLCFFSDPEEATSLAYSFTTPDLLALLSSLEEAAEALRANANVRLTMTDLAVKTGLVQ